MELITISNHKEKLLISREERNQIKIMASNLMIILFQGINSLLNKEAYKKCEKNFVQNLVQESSVKLNTIDRGILQSGIDLKRNKILTNTRMELVNLIQELNVKNNQFHKGLKKRIKNTPKYIKNGVYGLLGKFGIELVEFKDEIGMEFF